MSKLIKKAKWVWSFGASAFILLLSTGCQVSSSADPSAQSSADSNLSLSARISDIDVSLISLTDATRVTLKLRYSISGDTPDRVQLTDHLLAFKPPETTWLLLYVHHAAWQYMNDGTLPPGVEIEPTDIPCRGKGKWWCADADNAFYGETTLSLKQRNGEVLKVIPNENALETVWHPLTRESYPIWWTQVDEKLGLTKFFRPA